MNRSPASASRPRRSMWLWQLLLLLPPFAWLVLFAAGGYHQYRSRLWTAERVAEWQAAGRPTNSRELTESIFRQARSEGTLLWSELRALDFEVFPNPISNVSRRQHASPEPWRPNETAIRVHSLSAASQSQLADDLRHLRPRLDRLDQALQMPQPIWTPQAFHPDRFLYSWQQASGLLRVLYLDASLALQEQDRPLLLTKLQRIQNVAIPLSPPGPQAVSSGLAQQKECHLLFLICLSIPGWTADELAVLEQQITTPLDLSQAWQQSIDLQRVGSLERGARNEVVGAIPALQPWADSAALQAEMLRGIDAMERLDPTDLGRIPQGVETTREAGWSLGHQHGLRWVGQRVAELDSLRKLALFGVAIRRFKIATGRWPASLQEVQAGTSIPAELMSATTRELGYELSDEGPQIWLPVSYPIAWLPNLHPGYVPPSSHSQPTGDTTSLRAALTSVRD